MIYIIFLLSCPTYFCIDKMIAGHMITMQKFTSFILICRTMNTKKSFFLHYLKDKKVFFSLIFVSILFSGCGGNNAETKSDDGSVPATTAAVTNEEPADPMKNKGIGPVTEVHIGALDEALASKGKELFETNCNACHKLDQRYVGPSLGGVTERRSPEWIMNMILNPNEMVQKDPIAKELLAEYLAPMASQNLTQDETRAILEYFRQIDTQN